MVAQKPPRQNVHIKPPLWNIMYRARACESSRGKTGHYNSAILFKACSTAPCDDLTSRIPSGFEGGTMQESRRCLWFYRKWKRKWVKAVPSSQSRWPAKPSKENVILKAWIRLGVRFSLGQTFQDVAAARRGVLDALLSHIIYGVQTQEIWHSVSNACLSWIIPSIRCCVPDHADRDARSIRFNPSHNG